MLSDLEGIFVKYVSLLIALLIIAFAGTCAHSKYTIAKLVESGVDPIEASCAIQSGGEVTCRPLYFK